MDVATADVQDVELSEDAAPALSRVRRRALSKVGKTLQPNERLRLGPPLAGRPRAVVTPDVRQRLLAVDTPLVSPPTPTATSVVGVLTIFYQKGTPVWLTQMYLIATSVIIAWQLGQFPEWSTWALVIVLGTVELAFLPHILKQRWKS